MNKREDYLSWEQYFMGIAFLSAQRSKDPTTQVGACIVKDNKIIDIYKKKDNTTGLSGCRITINAMFELNKENNLLVYCNKFSREEPDIYIYKYKNNKFDNIKL